jgi:tetratricopeptide (TPR) repeat protein
MSQPAVAALASDLEELLRLGRWEEACALYERGMSREDKQDPANRLAYAIALIRSGRINSGVNLLSPELAALPDARATLRRHAIGWLVREKRFDSALAILDLLLAADPNAAEELRLRASLLGRSRQYGEAIADARRLAILQPGDLGAHLSCLQLLLQDGQASTAAVHARSLGALAAGHARLASIALLALIRDGQHQDAVELALAAQQHWQDDAEVIQAVVRAHFEAGDLDAAIAAGRHCLELGSDGAKLRHFLGQAYLAAGKLGEAIQHLSEAIRHEPVDPNSLTMLGEALVRAGRCADAIPHLAVACKRQPKVPHPRALFARALKQEGRHAEAAREFRQLLAIQPDSHRWHRYAAAALSQGGQHAEAIELFDDFVASRRRSLPTDFESGLRRLWDRVDEVSLPPARLDWAWRLRAGPAVDRIDWERRARWGYLADHYMLDWLECRDDLAHEAMARLADLSEVERKLSQVDRSRGVILASAHIGPMYAGPLALELLGLPAKWLASTPSAARTAYAGSLISTSDQTGAEVARKVMTSLGQGSLVTIAVDGALNLAAPRTPFEGQEITYSAFAARMAHRMSAPSLFVAPRWEGEQLGFVIERLPDAAPGESPEAFSARWRDAYLAQLRHYLGGEPENLRLSGGLWRHIRSRGPTHGG